MMPAKYILAGLAVLLTAAAAVCLRKRAGRSTDAIDGGVKHVDDGADAPKVIRSETITSFHCTVSLYAVDREEMFAGKKIDLEAVRQEGGVSGSFAWNDRINSGKSVFSAGADFMDALQKLVAGYDLARFNGRVSTVSGLPDMYGERLEICYDSGESIYAHNNQSGFLPKEARQAMLALFAAEAGINFTNQEE